MTSTTENPNPLLAWNTLPDFDAVLPEHVGPAVRSLLQEAQTQLTSIEARASELPIAELIQSLEQLEDKIGFAWGIANHLNSVRTTDELREAIGELQPEVIVFMSQIGQSRPLYEAYERAAQSGQLTGELKRVVELGLRGMQHSGVGLEGPAQERFNAIQQRLAELSLGFGNALVDATKAWTKDLTSPEEVAGLPESILGLLAQSATQAGLTQADGQAPTAQAGPWRLTLDAPCVSPFLEYAERRDLREELYRAYVGRAGPEGAPEFDNTSSILEILALRHELANLLGFKDYAALSLDSKMAPSVEAVDALMNELYLKAKPAAAAEHAELSEFAKTNGHQGALALWDIGYWARRLRETRYAYSDEELKPFFPLPAVLDGLFGLISRLFGVDVRPQPEVKGWHPDVRYFTLHAQENGEEVASFWLDPYSRPANKRGGAWMNELRGRSLTLGQNGKARTPIAYLVCNQAPPVGNKPSLMTWSEVETLFHEMGHGLQHMLTRVNWLAVSGINGVEWDAVELPSQFMENFLRHPAFLRSFARHYETGEVISDALVAKVLAASTYRAGAGFLRQLNFGQLDLQLHSGTPVATADALWALQREVAQQYAILAPLQTDRFLCSFGHLFAGGYAAGYYSYKWAEVLSADAFGAFEDVGLDNAAAMAETGRRFRDTVLALGGSVPPMEVFVAFRGREPASDALLRHNGLAA